ncbi:LamG-like jellyroll fold domain-containing protein [Streptomyces sp. NPDC001928]|uniref:Tc toxin subunit A-related protein n=1 Tax=Streptomyces sp. NPDC001928 TaxID=3154404 RepID=UPI003327ECF6
MTDQSPSGVRLDDDGDGRPYPTATLSVRFDVPAGGTAVTGAQPGVGVQLSGAVRYRRATDVRVWVRVGSVVFPATLGETVGIGRTWRCLARFYTRGPVEVLAEASGQSMIDDSPMEAVSEPRPFIVTLDSDVPDLTVVQPASGDVTVGEQGELLALLARTHDGFGPRTVTWECEGRTGGTVQQPTAPKDFTGRVPLTPLPLGARTLTVRCTDAAQNTTIGTATLTARDRTPPVLTIDDPRPGQTFAAGPDGVTVTVRGQASDRQSGMAGGRVEWSTDGGAHYTAATSRDDWATWQADVPLKDFGAFTIDVRACDHDGNTVTSRLPLQVVADYHPRDLDERLDARSYLAALLAFTRDHVRTSQGANLSSSDLQNTFQQRFGTLGQPLSQIGDAGTVQVNQLLVACEVLRAHWAANPDQLLVTHWSFDAETIDGDTAADLSGGGHEAVATGGIVLEDGRGGGQAVRFDGTDRYLTVPTGPAVGDGGADFTVAFHLRLEEGFTGKWRSVLHKGAVNEERTFAIWLTPGSNRLHARISTDNNWNEGLDTTAEVPVGRWTHVTYVKNGAQLRLYLDGTLDRAVTLMGHTVANQGPLYIGKDPWYDGFDGLIDDLRILRFALEEDAIRALAAAPDPSTLADTEASGRTAYVWAAYEAFLAGIGTSYEELRLARGAAPSDRTALADRIGIRLTDTDPDELTRLTLTPAAADEALLEELFGLRDTDPARGPLRPTVTPLLAQWRERALTLRWYATDHAPQPADRGFDVLVDPDLISPDDLATATVGNPAAALLQARRDDVHAIRETLRSARETGGASAAEQLTALLKTGLPDIDLPAIAAEQDQGVDIGPALAAIPLSREAFASLLRTRRLAGTGSVTTAEWEDAYDILTAVDKARAIETWRAEESLINLGPDFFRLSDASVPLPRWRASRAGRDAWQRTLRTRIQERHAAAEAWHFLVAEVEEATLPVLRDALLAGAAGLRVAAAAGAEWLTTRLQLDLRASGSLRTTRIAQATETLQSLLFALRTGRFPDGHPARAWTLVDEAAFDEALQWMSTQDGWRAAMTAYLYPENLMHPSLLRDASAPLTSLLRQLRQRRRLTAEEARELAATYYAAQLPVLHADRLPRTFAAWTFDEGTGSTAKDPAGNTGTLHGPHWTTGAIGKALAFDGIDDLVALQRTHELNAITDNFTISFWAAPDSPHEIDPESSDGTTGTSGQRYAYAPAHGSSLGGPDHAGVGVSVGTNGVSVYEHADNYLPPVLVHEAPLSGWTHIAVVYEDRQPRLFVDGRLVRSRNNPSAMTAVHAAPDALGGMAYGHFHGRLDDIRVYGSQLTPNQIELLAFRITDRRDRKDLAAVRTLSRRLLYVVNDDPPWIHPQGAPVVEMFAHVDVALAMKLCESGEYLAALDWWQNLYAHDLPPDQRIIYHGLTIERNDPPHLDPTGGWTAVLDPYRIARTRPNPHTRSVLFQIARCCAEYGAAEHTRDTPDSIARARTLYTTALDLLSLPELQPAIDPAAVERPLPNPALEALRSSVTAQLAKLREGRTISGLPRAQTEPDGQAASVRPTQYRYRTLIERTRQYTALAQQAEQTYLDAMEKHDAAAFRWLEAGHALELARSDLTIQTLRVAEAHQAVDVAQAQRRRADATTDQYRQLITGGLNQYEKSMLSGYSDAKRLRDTLAVTEAQIAVGQAASGAVLPWQWGIAGGLTAAAVGRGVVTGFLNAAEARLQADTLLASHERQTENWRLQIGLAAQDALVAEQQVLLAADQQAIAREEQRAARLRADQAQATLDFLDRQFTNPELYEWMSGILAGVYRSLLQQATALARLAQGQLAFERQEPPAGIILADYWQPPSDGTAADQPGTTRDRRGLTGSARLLQDVARLDEYAFRSERRKLNLSQTFSLAQQAPLEFEQFRQTGVLPFSTPMDWFDRDFPGHHLRLIKRVSVSVVGLVPPVRGIRGTLASTGLSRVVVAGETVREIVLRHEPERVAFTSVQGATGVFDLDPQSDLQHPFEGQGVDTTWELQLPRAANPFDYASLADVRFTMEYTALHDDTYRRQVIQRLNRDRTTAGDRAFSLLRDFPDQWYDLHDPATSRGPRQVTLTLTEDELPSTLEHVTVTHLALLLVTPSPPSPFDITLHHADRGGQARPTEGLISTRRGNAPAWSAIRGTTPVGDWTLTLAEEAAEQIDDGTLSDVLLVVGFEGMTPVWQ